MGVACSSETLLMPKAFFGHGLQYLMDLTMCMNSPDALTSHSIELQVIISEFTSSIAVKQGCTNRGPLPAPVHVISGPGSRLESRRNFL